MLLAPLRGWPPAERVQDAGPPLPFHHGRVAPPRDTHFLGPTRAMEIKSGSLNVNPS